VAAQYSTRDFFRQIPNRLLAEYFRRRGLFVDLDFDSLPETRPHELFAKWLALPDANRDAMDAQFRDVQELSCEKGFRALIDEASYHFSAQPEIFDAFVERLSTLANHHERAMTAFLEYPEFWRGATHFYHADALHFWRKRKNLPHVPAAVDNASAEELAAAMRDYFHRSEGRGRNCVVEQFRRDSRDYFFAYPEDFSQQSVEWVNGEFGRRPHNPAFEVVFAYSELEGTLDLNFRGARYAVEPLQRMFARAILKLEDLPPDAKDERVYDLNPLKDRRFQFVFDDASGIGDVFLKRIRLASKVRPGTRLTIEADRNSIYDELEQIGKARPLDLYNVTQVELTAMVQRAPDEPPKAVAIRVTYPNSCSLKYDPLDLMLRDMLRASGIEPRQPSADGSAAVAA
jgi:hypothetical protein